MGLTRSYVWIVVVALLFTSIGIAQNGTSNVVTIKASSDRDFGRQVGERFGSLYSKTASTLSLKTPLLLKEMRETAEDIYPIIQEYPELLERFQGLSESLDVPVKDLIATSLMLITLIKPGCTTTAATPPSTLNGEVYTSWNVDVVPTENAELTRLIQEIVGHVPLIVVSISGRYKYVIFGIPVIAGFGLLNEKGLTCVANAVNMKDRGIGVPYIYINNLAMEKCSTVKEAADLVERTPRLVFSSTTPVIGAYTYDLNLNLIFTDAEEGIVAIESSHHYFAANYGISPSGKKGILAQTNHHQYLDRNLTGNLHYLEDPDRVGSFMRRDRCWDLLEENYGQIDLKVIQSIMRDHVMIFPEDYTGNPKYGSSICSHRFDSGTLCSFIIQPKEYIIWFCEGFPCEGVYVPHDMRVQLLVA